MGGGVTGAVVDGVGGVAGVVVVRAVVIGGVVGGVAGGVADGVAGGVAGSVAGGVVAGGAAVAAGPDAVHGTGLLVLDAELVGRIHYQGQLSQFCLLRFSTHGFDLGLAAFARVAAE